MVHIRTPYSLTKNIGQQYNKEFETVPDEDSLCVLDGDMMFCNSNFGHIINEYANLFPNDVLTCYTNRTHPLSAEQQHPICHTSNIEDCLKTAAIIGNDRTATEVRKVVSMLLMVIPKKIWRKFPFVESNQYRPGETNMLGVDSEWTGRIRAHGVRIMRMNGLLMYHQYRLLDGSKKHLL